MKKFCYLLLGNFRLVNYVFWVLISSNFLIISEAIAFPVPKAIAVPSQIIGQQKESIVIALEETELPLSVQSAVLTDASQRVSLPVANLRIIKAEKHQWSDGCLGLAEAEEICTQAIVPGWQVTVTDGQCQWVYRTDDYGKLLRLEQQISEKKF